MKRQRRVTPAPADEIEMARRLFDQVMTIWIKPEIERRRQRGVLDPDFRLRAAQVVLPSPLDGRGNRVRLNEEVAAVLSYRLDKPDKEGDLIEISSVDRIQAIRLPDGEDPNAAHLTMLRVGGQWFIGFDFTYNRARGNEHLAAAEEFLQVAQLSIGNGLFRPAVENLFAAVELAAEAEMLLTPRDGTKKHQERARRFKEWVQLGNAPAKTDLALYGLSELRIRARYLEGPFSLTGEKLDEYCRAGGELIAHVRQRIKGPDERAKVN